MERNNKTPELIELLIDKIKKDYLEDISIIYLYGSYLNEDFHELSDIDLFIVTKSNKGYNLGFTVILNGIGYDFWTVSWEWVEQVANYDDRSPSLITEGKVIYYGSENDLSRFNKLSEKASSIDKNKYIEKVAGNMKNIYETVFLINNSNDITEI